MAHLSGERLACDLLWEVMDQVAHLDRKVSALLAAAGIPEPVKAGSEDEGSAITEAINADPDEVRRLRLSRQQAREMCGRSDG